MNAVSAETVRLIVDLATPPLVGDEPEVRRVERLAALPGFVFEAVPLGTGDGSLQTDDCHRTARARLAALLPSALASGTSYPIRQGPQRVLLDLGSRAPTEVRHTLEPDPEVQAFEPSDADRQMALEGWVMGSFQGVVEEPAFPLLVLTAALATSFVLWLLI